MKKYTTQELQENDLWDTHSYSEKEVKANILGNKQKFAKQIQDALDRISKYGTITHTGEEIPEIQIKRLQKMQEWSKFDYTAALNDSRR